MALYIPKMVVLQNDMLARCYLVFYFFTAGSMLSWFYLSGSYLLSVSLRHTTRMNMWVTTLGDGALNDTLLARQGDVCGSPSDYDYWWDEEWQYNGSKCVEVTSNCRTQASTCLKTSEIYVKESPTQIFLTTWMETYRQRLDGEIEEPSRFYVPQANAFSVSFQYYFTVPHRPRLRSSQVVSRPPVDEEHRLSNEEVMTVFLDSKRDIAWIAKPGEPLEMSVPVILQLAGYTDHLITPNPKWGKNVFPGAKYPEGPIGMIGGLPLEIVVHCHKTPKRNLGEDYDYWTGPTCFVIATAQEIWSERHGSDRLGPAGVLNSYQCGIRITGEMDGTWEYFDLNNCILSFTALLVLLRLPKTLMTLIACRALGHLSKIYRAVIFQKYYIEEQIAGAAARILTHSASFREVEHSDGSGGLSNQDLHDAISYVAQPRKEDAPSSAHDVAIKTLTDKSSQERESSVMMFSEFAFNAMCNPMYRDCGRKARFIRKVFGTKVMRAVEAMFLCLFDEEFVVQQEDSVKEDRVASRVSADHFISTAVSSEQVRYESLLMFFNVRRVIGPLERLFMPTFVSKYFEQKHQELREAEKFQTPWSQEAPAGEEMGDQGGVGPSTDDFKVSNRALIKRLREDVRHVRESKERPAAATNFPDRLPDGGLLADRPSSHRAPTGMPRLAPGETLATLSSTAAKHARPPRQAPADKLPMLSPAAANHARPPGPEGVAKAGVEVNVLDSEMLRYWRDGHQAAVLGRKAADHARPPGPEKVQGADDPADSPVVDTELLASWHEDHQALARGRPAAEHARPPGQGEAAEGSGLHLSRSELLAWACNVREQSPGGSRARRPVLPPGQPTDGGAASADAAADGTRQPRGKG